MIFWKHSGKQRVNDIQLGNGIIDDVIGDVINVSDFEQMEKCLRDYFNNFMIVACFWVNQAQNIGK